MEESGLFELIKTLSKTEKRYFKKYASLHHSNKGSHAVLLFDALEKPHTFDAGEFRKKNSDQPFYKNLASEKQHLMRVLLQSLHEYHRNNNSRARIHYHIDSFDLLFEKRQYKLCEKHLAKTIELAYKFNQPHYLFEIYRCLGKLYQHSGNLPKLKEMLDRVKQEEKELFIRTQSEFSLKMKEYKSFYISRAIGYPRTKKDHAAYEDLLHSAFSISRKDASFSEQLMLLTIRNYYLDSLPDKRPLMKVREEWIRMAEQNPDFISDNSTQYLVSLNNVANSYDELGMETEMEDALNKINRQARKNLDEEVRAFIYYYNLKLLRYINTGQFTECITHFPQAEKGLEKYGRWFHPEYKLSFRYLFSYGYFGAGKFKEALFWTNEMIRNYPKETLEEYYNFARIFILLIYFELGHESLLESEMRSAKRYFSIREKLYPLEKTILSFIRASLKPEGIKATRKDFADLKARISELKNSPYEQQLFSLFDWMAWVENKINGTSMEETVQRRLKAVGA
jgi:hypothetical protein